MTDLVQSSPMDKLRSLFRDLKRRLTGWSRDGSSGMSAVERSNDTPGWEVSIALPGVAPENVEVNAAGQAVHVRAVKKNGDIAVTYYEQVVIVPDLVDVENIAARYRHGLLELILPEKAAAQPRRIDIDMKAGEPLQAA